MNPLFICGLIVGFCIGIGVVIALMILAAGKRPNRDVENKS